MAETRTSVREVIPDVGGRFSLDEGVVNCALTLPPAVEECYSEAS